MIHLDGSSGEGGGQVLRSSLSLALVTGQPFTLTDIRAGRRKPGLQRQHLTAVLAAKEVCAADVDGMELGSRRLVFRPSRVRGGDYRFAIGTAGSTSLVLQTLLPALLTADEPSTVVVHGGTHNAFAPPFEFLDRTFSKALRRFGAQFDLRLHRHGFHPAGGGILAASIRPSRLAPTELLRRGEEQPLRATVLLSQLPTQIGERELQCVRARMGQHLGATAIVDVDSPGPGNILLLEREHELWTEVVSSPGDRTTSCEKVAERACLAATEYLSSTAPVGEHLADQLLLPMAMAGGGAFRTLAPSQHTKTNAAVIERFLPVSFAFTETRSEGGIRDWIVSVAAR